MAQLFEFMVNHWALWLAFFLVLALLVYTEKGGFSQLSLLSPTQIIPLINHQSAVILDMRNAEAFASGHIINAIHFPLGDAESKIKTIQKHKKKPLILIDENQRDTSKMAALLRKNGFNEIVALRNGLNAWREAQLPLVIEKIEKIEKKEKEEMK